MKKGQIAHLDQDPGNNSTETLVFLCLEHHDEYDSRTSQSKGLAKREVKRYRDQLYEHFAVAPQHDGDRAGQIVAGLRSKEFSVNGRRFTYADILTGTAAELSTGVSLAYFGVLLVDLLGLGDTAIGWGSLRTHLGFEASVIFGEFVLLGLWQLVQGSDPKEERYCLTDLGRSVVVHLRKRTGENDGA